MSVSTCLQCLLGLQCADFVMVAADQTNVQSVFVMKSGLQCADFVMVAADQTNVQSVFVMKSDQNKIHVLSDKLLMGVVGSVSDSEQFAQFVTKNLDLYKRKNNYQLDVAAAVHFTRKNLADGLRSENPTCLNILMAGYDNQLGSQLYSLDFFASCVKVPYASHGFGGLLGMSILDRYHKSKLTPLEAYEVMKLCIQEIHRRFFISLPNFQVKVVSKDGIREMPTINACSFTPPTSL